MHKEAGLKPLAVAASAHALGTVLCPTLHTNAYSDLLCGGGAPVRLRDLSCGVCI